MINTVCSLHRFFLFLHAACTAILCSNWKNNTIFMVSKIQTMIKLNNPSTTTFARLFLTVVRFNLLEWWYSHKKWNLLLFLFSLRNLYFCDYDDCVQIWQSKLQYTLHLKSLVQILICNVVLTVIELEGEKCLVYILKIKSNSPWAGA